MKTYKIKFINKEGDESLFTLSAYIFSEVMERVLKLIDSTDIGIEITEKITQNENNKTMA